MIKLFGKYALLMAALIIQGRVCERHIERD